MEGVVLRSINNIYSVRTSQGEVFSCRIKGKHLAQASGEYNPIVVGDIVDFTQSGTNEGLVTSRHDRLTALGRYRCGLVPQFPIQLKALLLPLGKKDVALVEHYHDRHVATARKDPVHETRPERRALYAAYAIFYCIIKIFIKTFMNF